MYKKYIVKISINILKYEQTGNKDRMIGITAQATHNQVTKQTGQIYIVYATQMVSANHVVTIIGGATILTNIELHLSDKYLCAISKNSV